MKRQVRTKRACMQNLTRQYSGFVYRKPGIILALAGLPGQAHSLPMVARTSDEIRWFMVSPFDSSLLHLACQSACGEFIALHSAARRIADDDRRDCLQSVHGCAAGW
jgi:hypothetical protein